MPAVRPSPFDTLETAFRLLSSGPAPLAVDGRRLGRGLPRRLITVRELRVLLVCYRGIVGVQRVVLDELIHCATQGGSGWVVGLAGVLLPGFRRVAALAQPRSARAMCEVEADLLGRYRLALARSHTEVADLAGDLLRIAQAGSLRIQCRAPMSDVTLPVVELAERTAVPSPAANAISLMYQVPQPRTSILDIDHE
jgi:hypothetical protein